MFPKTMDEMKAEAENEQLQKEEMPEVLETDDHTTHIYTHMMVTPKTWATWFHIDWHQKLLAEQKKKEMQAQEQALNDSMGATEGSSPSSKPQIGAEKKNPISAASSLKSEIMSDNQSKING